MQPIISIPRHWGYPRFVLEQRTEQGTILGLYYYPSGTELAEQFDEGWLKATRRSARHYQIRRWHLKQFFDNPPQSIKKRIAALDVEAINYLLGRKT